MRKSLIAIASVCLLTGCAVGSSTLRPLAVDQLHGEAEAAAVSPVVLPADVRAVGKASATTAAAPAPSLAAADCELRLFAEQLPNSNPQGIRNGAMGAFFVERAPGTGDGVVSGVCVKHAGQALRLPSRILIATDPRGPQLSRFCGEPAKHYVLVPPKLDEDTAQAMGTAEKRGFRVSACAWDGTFHSARPFTFSLMTAKDAAVGNYVEAFRVYRNGDLMAAWNYASDAPRPDQVVIGGGSLTSGLWAATHPPHLAAMDLRIVPRETGITHVVETEVRDDRARFLARTTTALKAAGDVALPKDSAERQSLDCLVAQFHDARAKIMSAVDKQELPTLPRGCNPLTKAGGSTPLSDAYRDAKNQSKTELEALLANADRELESLRKEVESNLPGEVKKVLTDVYEGIIDNPELSNAQKQKLQTAGECIAKFGTPGGDAPCWDRIRGLPEVARILEPLLQTVSVVDQDVSVLLQTADETRLLAMRLADRGKDILNHPQQQAAIFNAFAASLSAQGNTFEPHKDNPPLIASEQKLEMQYADPIQGFMLAPWNAVPLRVNDQLEADLSASVVLPMLDVLGLRVQWGRSRFADFRAAIGMGFIQTEDPDTKGKQSAWLPNLSLGVATLKVGAGYAVGEHLGSAIERTRLLVGVDLFKLVSGSNVEAL